MGTLATRRSQASGKRRRQRMREQGKTPEEIAQLEAARRERQQERRERAETQRSGLATRDNRSSVTTGAPPMAAGFGSQATAATRPGTGALNEAVRATEEQQAEDLIEEREEVLEEPGGSSSSTEELGDDENEEAKALTRSIRVLYSFNPTYTSGQFIESLDPKFRKIKADNNASQEQKEKIREARRKAKRKGKTSILIGRMAYKVGKARVQDFRAMTDIREPKLFINKRRFRYSLEEQDKLRELVSNENFKITKITEGVDSFLDIPQFERVESPVLVNKFEIQNQFRLSPISDAPIQVDDVTIDPIRDRTIPLNDSAEDDSSRPSQRTGLRVDSADPDVSAPDGPGFGDIDAGLIRDLERDRQYRQQDFGAESRLAFDRLEEVPPPPSPGRGPSGGGGGY